MTATLPASDRLTALSDNRPPLVEPAQLQVDHHNLTDRLAELERLAANAPARIDEKLPARRQSPNDQAYSPNRSGLQSPRASPGSRPSHVSGYRTARVR